MQYLASPYSAAPRENYEIVSRVVWDALRLRNMVWFSPIVYMHEMSQRFGGPSDWESYASFNHHMLKQSSSLIILTADGWNESAGVKKEFEWARNMQMPIDFIDEFGRLTMTPETLQWQQ